MKKALYNDLSVESFDVSAQQVRGGHGASGEPFTVGVEGREPLLNRISACVSFPGTLEFSSFNTNVLMNPQSHSFTFSLVWSSVEDFCVSVLFLFCV